MSDSASPSTTASVSYSNLILAIILVSYTMIVIDNSVVITGLPKIKTQLAFTSAGLSWVSSAYALTFGGLLLLCARAGDILGRRHLLVAGLALFTLSSLCIGLAPTAEWLVVSRAVQGIGAAMLAPSTLAILQVTFADGHARARAISLYAAAGGLSASIGLVVGGIVADLISWRAGFLINVPIGILLIICALRFIPETARHRGKFDVGGAVLSALGMTGLVYATISSVSNGWLSITTMLTFAASIILLWVFVLVEKHAQQPIMPLRLFHSSVRSGAYLARILYIGAAMGFFFFSTQFMQGVLHYSAIQAGLAFLPAMLINFLVALQVPRLTGRFGSQNLLLISLLAVLLGMALLSRLDAQSHYLSGLLLPLILMGFGIGGATGPLTAMGLSGVAANDAGAASGLINAAHQMGGALGLSIMVATAVAGSSHLEGISLMLHQNHLAFLAGAGLVALSVVIVLGLINRK